MILMNYGYIFVQINKGINLDKTYAHGIWISTSTYGMAIYKYKYKSSRIFTLEQYTNELRLRGRKEQIGFVIGGIPF